MGHVTGLIAFFANGVRRVLGVAAAMLPRRWWPELDWYVPASGSAQLCAVLTVIAGGTLAIYGFLTYASQLSSDILDAAWDAAQRNPQRDETIGVALRSGPMAFMSMALPLFLFTTPLGWLSMYLVVTGVVRAVAGVFEDGAFGDPLLTGIDKAVLGGARRGRARLERAQRDTLAGPEMPDRVMSAAQLGIEGADFVVVSSRPKPDWDKGTVVMTEQGAFRVGAIEERTIAGRLRTLYPLTEHKDFEVFRRTVHYELPPGRRT